LIVAIDTSDLPRGCWRFENRGQEMLCDSDIACKDLAQTLGVTQSRLSVLRSRGKPNDAEKKRLAQKLQIPLHAWAEPPTRAIFEGVRQHNVRARLQALPMISVGKVPLPAPERGLEPEVEPEPIEAPIETPMHPDEGARGIAGVQWSIDALHRELGATRDPDKRDRIIKAIAAQNIQLARLQHENPMEVDKGNLDPSQLPSEAQYLWWRFKRMQAWLEAHPGQRHPALDEEVGEGEWHLALVLGGRVRYVAPEELPESDVHGYLAQGWVRAR
jgi:hypothetical protein